MRKVCFVLPSLLGGGTERIVSNLASLLSEKFETWIVTLEKGKSYELDRQVKYITLTPLDGRSSPYKKVFYSFFQLHLLKEFLHKKKFDVFLPFLYRTCFLTSMIPLNRNRVIFNFRSFQSKNIHTGSSIIGLIKKNFYEMFLRRVPRYCKLITVNSKAALWDMEEHFNVHRKQLKVIYNFVDVSFIEASKGEPISYNLSLIHI